MTANRNDRRPPGGTTGIVIAAVIVIIAIGMIWLMLANYDPPTMGDTATQPTPKVTVQSPPANAPNVVVQPPVNTGTSPGVPQVPAGGQQ